MPDALRVVAAAVIVAVALAWALVAATVTQAVGVTEFDAACYAPRPLWAIGQAVLALAGVSLSVRGALVLASSSRSSPRSPQALRLAAVLLATWLVVFVALAPDLEIVLCEGQPPESR